MDKKYYWYIGAVVVFILLIAFYVWNKSKQAAAGATGTTGTGGTTGGTTSGILSSIASIFSKGNTFPLQLYSNGTNVTRWQKALNRLGETLTTDGLAGQKTIDASIRRTGKGTITEMELTALESQAIPTTTNNATNTGVTGTGTPSTTGVNKLDQLAFDLIADLELKTYILGRQAEYPYTDLYNLPDADFKLVAEKYAKLNTEKGGGLTLYADVDKAYFRSSTNIDANILNRLSLLGIK